LLDEKEIEMSDESSLGMLAKLLEKGGDR